MFHKRLLKQWVAQFLHNKPDDELTEEDRENLNVRYTLLLEDQITDWSTDKVRAEIRVAIAECMAREQERKTQIASNAKHLAELKCDAETVHFKEQLARVWTRRDMSQSMAK